MTQRLPRARIFIQINTVGIQYGPYPLWPDLTSGQFSNLAWSCPIGTLCIKNIHYISPKFYLVSCDLKVHTYTWAKQVQGMFSLDMQTGQLTPRPDFCFRARTPPLPPRARKCGSDSRTRWGQGMPKKSPNVTQNIFWPFLASGYVWYLTGFNNVCLFSLW